MKKMFYIYLLTVLTLITTFNLSAQKTEDDKLPFEAIGAGVTLGSMGDYGVLGTYALTKDIHIGAKLGFLFKSAYTTNNVDYEAETALTFSPFLKYYLEKIKYAYPFIMASFSAETVKQNVITNGIVDTRDKTQTNFNIFVGADWYPYKGVGVSTGIKIIQTNIDPFQFFGGLGDAYIGLNFFF